MAAGTPWPLIPSNAMLTYDDVQRAIDEGYLSPGPSAPPAGHAGNELISAVILREWISNKVNVHSENQIVWKSAVDAEGIIIEPPPIGL